MDLKNLIKFEPVDITHIVITIAIVVIVMDVIHDWKRANAESDALQAFVDEYGEFPTAEEFRNFMEGK